MLSGTARADSVRDRLEGLVYEAEQWSQPPGAWIENRETPDHWNLWTTEQDVASKRSMGASLRSPVAHEDRGSPEEGAPPLHTRITGIPAGTYRVYMNDPGRFIAYSFDGRQWQRGEPQGEIALGVFDIRDGTFELWVDDRFATPSNIGPCYYDYIRMVPWPPPELDRFAACRLADDRVQVSWISSEPIDTGVLEADDGSGFRPVASSDETGLRNHRVTFNGSKSGRQMHVRARVRLGPRYDFISDPVSIDVPGKPPARSPATRQIPLGCAAEPLAERPMLVSAPLAPGELWRAEDALVEYRGHVVPSQSSVSARWLDGSVKWLFVRCLPGNDASGLNLRLGPAVQEAANPFSIHRAGDRLVIDNGRLRFAWDRTAVALFDDVSDSGGTRLAGKPLLGNVRVMDDAGTAWGLGPPDRLELEEAGPVRAVLRAEGPFNNDAGQARFRYRIRYFLTAGSPLVHVQLTLINDAAEPVFQPLHSFAMRVPVAGDEPLRGRLAGGDMVSVAEPDRHDLQQITENRLRVTADGRTVEQEGRCSGWAVIERGDRRIALAIRDFWQTWPKGLALKPDGLHVRLLPPLAQDEYEARDIMDWARHLYWFKDGRYMFKRGMALRAEFWVRFDRAADAMPSESWSRWADAVASLPYASVWPAQYCASGAFGPLAPAGDTTADYERMVERSVKSVLDNREQRGEYGWMNFGDWHGERSFNWGNSEYDLAWAMAVQFARTGRWDFFTLGEQMTRHCITIDAIHVPWAQAMTGRVYAHSVGHVGAGYEPAGTAFDEWRQKAPWHAGFFHGGIDAAGHIHQEGNFAYWFLTGDRDYLETAEMVAGAQAAYLTRRFDFGIERSAGWPIINAVAAYEATGNPFYLNAARLYVERVLAKQDPAGGSWLLPQDPTECDHPPPHLGSKSFATGVLLYGLMRYDLVEPRDDVKRSIVRACEWLAAEAWNAEKRGFRYKTGCDKFADSADSGGSMALCAPCLAYAWTLKPDPRFREVLEASLARINQATGDIGKSATMLTRQSAFALPIVTP